jgi:hypothetical protein
MEPVAVAFFEYRRAGEQAAWDHDDVAAYLAARGYAIGLGGVGCGVDGDAALVRADLDRDPAADLAAYAPPLDAYRANRKYLRQRLAEIKAKPAAELTTGDRDLRALLGLMREDT